eukprot:scaffold362_cov176-Amphora_coffeaeformis.AAC.17
MSSSSSSQSSSLDVTAAAITVAAAGASKEGKRPTASHDAASVTTLPQEYTRTPYTRTAKRTKLIKPTVAGTGTLLDQRNEDCDEQKSPATDALFDDGSSDDHEEDGGGGALYAVRLQKQKLCDEQRDLFRQLAVPSNVDRLDVFLRGLWFRLEAATVASDAPKKVFSAHFQSVGEIESVCTHLEQNRAAVATISHWTLQEEYVRGKGSPTHDKENLDIVKALWTRVFASLRPAPRFNLCRRSYTDMMLPQLSSALQDYLTDNHHLREIRISTFGSLPGLELAGTCLRRQPGLRKVSIECNRLYDPSSWPKIGRALEEIATGTNLTEFSIEAKVRDRDIVDSERVQFGILALLGNPRLRVFRCNLRTSWDGTACRQRLATALLRTNVTRMDWMNVWWEAPDCLFDALAQTDVLKELYLDGSHRNHQYFHLRLDNPRRDSMKKEWSKTDWDSVSKYLSRTKELRHLHVSSGSLLTKLFPILLNNTSLEVASFSQGFFLDEVKNTSEKAANFLQLVERHPRLRKLSVSSEHTSAWLHHELWRTLRNNSSIIEDLQWQYRFGFIVGPSMEFTDLMKEWMLVLRHNTRLRVLGVDEPEEISWENQPDVHRDFEDYINSFESEDGEPDLDFSRFKREKDEQWRENIETNKEQRKIGGFYREEMNGWLKVNGECGEIRKLFLAKPEGAKKTDIVLLLAAAADIPSCSYQILCMSCSVLFGNWGTRGYP